MSGVYRRIYGGKEQKEKDGKISGRKTGGDMWKDLRYISVYIRHAYGKEKENEKEKNGLSGGRCYVCEYIRVYIRNRNTRRGQSVCR